MKIFLGNVSKFSCDTLIVFDHQTKGKKSSTLVEDLDKKFSGLIKEFIGLENFNFNLAESLVINVSKKIKVNPKFKSVRKIILVGLGENSGDFSQWRKVYASAIRKSKEIKSERLAVWEAQQPELFAELTILLSYEFVKYKTQKDRKPNPLKEVVLLNAKQDAALKKSIKTMQIIAQATCSARDLVWEPACVVTPTYLAEEAKKLDSDVIKVSIKEAAECKKLGMGSFLAVAQGSDQPPKFIEFTYKPEKPKKHIALIGKGVTFDSGGLSLKPAKSMEMMKEDMSGAAAIIGIIQAVSQLRPNVQITAIIAATENMPSGKAYRPGDVITAMNGKTIEVNNTDAEGRLTLADAVAYVSTKHPDEIIDFATLTGACSVALGNIAAGLMGNDEDLITRLKNAAQKTGELVWQLPLFEEYKQALKSPIADLLNAGSNGKAGAQNGALFIQEFVGKQKDSDKPISWAHIDIAGPCWFEQDMDWANKGASGVPVRTILEYLLTVG